MNIGKDDLIRIISALNTLHEETAHFFNSRGLNRVPGTQALAELSAFRAVELAGGKR